MAKNLSKSEKQPVAKEKDASLDPERMAASPNLGSFAYDAPLQVNKDREQPHMGNMPARGSGKF